MKEKRFKKGITRRLFSVVLALAMVICIMPCMSLPVYAATSYTITYNGSSWSEITEASEDKIKIQNTSGGNIQYRVNAGTQPMIK